MFCSFHVFITKSTFIRCSNTHLMKMVIKSTTVKVRINSLTKVYRQISSRPIISKANGRITTIYVSSWHNELLSLQKQLRCYKPFFSTKLPTVYIYFTYKIDLITHHKDSPRFKNAQKSSDDRSCTFSSSK